MGAARRRWVSVLISSAIVIGLGAWIWTNGSETLSAATELDTSTIALGLIATMAGALIAAYAWWTAVRGLGAELPLRSALMICLVGQLGKYLPGSLWPALMQAELAQQRNVARPIVITGFAVSLVASLSAGAVIGTGVLLPSAHGADASSFLTDSHAWATVAAVVLSAGFLAMFLQPGIVITVLDRVLSRWVEAESLRIMDRTALRQCLALSLLGWIVTGLHLWFLVMSFGVDPVTAFPLSVGGLAAATVIGSLAVFSPGGLGVREVVLIGCLTAIMPTPSAVVVAAASRLLTLVGECLLTLIAFVAYRMSKAAPHRKLASKGTAQ